MKPPRRRLTRFKHAVLGHNSPLTKLALDTSGLV